MNNKIKSIYTGKFHKKYESKQQHMLPIKKEAIKCANLKNGDSVALFGCGTGMEFEYIQSYIGSKGEITALDYSPKMLKIAQNKIDKNGWANINLIEGDMRKLKVPEVDCVFCTLCLSIITEWDQVIINLIKSVKSGGSIVIGDMQLAKGWKSIGNPFSIFLSRSFGGTYKGHANTAKAIRLLSEYSEVKLRKTYLMDSYLTHISIKK